MGHAAPLSVQGGEAPTRTGAGVPEGAGHAPPPPGPLPDTETGGSGEDRREGPHPAAAAQRGWKGRLPPVPNPGRCAQYLQLLILLAVNLKGLPDVLGDLQLLVLEGWPELAGQDDGIDPERRLLLCGTLLILLADVGINATGICHVLGEERGLRGPRTGLGVRPAQPDWEPQKPTFSMTSQKCIGASPNRSFSSSTLRISLKRCTSGGLPCAPHPEMLHRQSPQGCKGTPRPGGDTPRPRGEGEVQVLPSRPWACSIPAEIWGSPGTRLPKLLGRAHPAPPPACRTTAEHRPGLAWQHEAASFRSRAAAQRPLQASPLGTEAELVQQAVGQQRAVLVDEEVLAAIDADQKADDVRGAPLGTGLACVAQGWRPGER